MGSPQPDDIQAKLSSADPVTQQAALRSISNRDSAAGLTLAVVTLTDSRDDGVRALASESLEKVNVPQVGDVAALIKILEMTAGQDSADGESCYWSATLLGRLGPDAREAVSALEHFADCASCLAARERAVWALARIGPAAFDSIPTLEALTLSAPPRLRQLARTAIDDIRQPILVVDEKSIARKRAA